MGFVCLFVFGRASFNPDRGTNPIDPIAPPPRVQDWGKRRWRFLLMLLLLLRKMTVGTKPKAPPEVSSFFLLLREGPESFNDLSPNLNSLGGKEISISTVKYEF